MRDFLIRDDIKKRYPNIHTALIDADDSELKTIKKRELLALKVNDFFNTGDLESLVDIAELAKVFYDQLNADNPDVDFYKAIDEARERDGSFLTGRLVYVDDPAPAQDQKEEG